MSRILLEGDLFNTTDIQALFKTAASVATTKPADTAPNDKNETAADAQVASKDKKITDWGKEYDDRVAANKALSPAARKSDYDLKTEFFTEFYSAIWGADLGKHMLSIGDFLQISFIKLGFVADKNPIYKFLTLDYVKTNLLQTKLINANTFTAIFNSIKDRLVAHTEFFNANAYNLLYCRDWYKQSVSTMMEYLKIQNSNLSANASSYSAQDLMENRKIFLSVETISAPDISERAKAQLQLEDSKIPAMTDSAAKLNDLKFAQAILELTGKKLTDEPNSKDKSDEQENETNLGTTQQQELVKNLKSPAQIMATLQYLSLTTDSRLAREALANKKLKSIPVTDLIVATPQIKKYMPKARISTKDADALANLLIRKL